jgi:hypothetical protein
MIQLLSQTEAERHGLATDQVVCVSPYLNPHHVLAPPLTWLYALVQGSYSWHFFRLRYKNLLRNRLRDEPEAFFALLDASQDGQSLYLTCHCLSDPCHREIAREFLEKLREGEAYRQWRDLRPLHLAALTPPAASAPAALR